VGRRVRSARAQAGLSQRALAFPGCTPAYVSRIEVGARTPSLQLLEELARRLGVSAAYLARGEDAPPAVTPWLAEAEVALRLGELEQARALYERALAEDAGPRARSQAHEGLGEVAFRSGHAEQAVRALEEALRVDSRDVVARPALAESLARAYVSLGQLAHAIAILERCVAEYEARDRVLYARFAALLGYALAERAELGRAEQLVSKAIGAAGETTDPYARARSYWSRSQRLAEAGHADEADDYMCQTLQLLRATEDTNAIAGVLHTLARLCLELGHPRQALALLRQSEPLVNAAGTRAQIADHHIDVGHTLAAITDEVVTNGSEPTRTSGTPSRGESHSQPARSRFRPLIV
jgi:tetratricopeptide (TPR) repeat protein